MANYRRGRINDEMQRVVAEVLREVKDPRVRDAFVSVTGAEVTADLKYAKIYYSALRGDAKEVRDGLKSSVGFIRRMVAERLNLRITPAFSFVEDPSIANGAHISSLLHQIEREGSGGAVQETGGPAASDQTEDAVRANGEDGHDDRNA